MGRRIGDTEEDAPAPTLSAGQDLEDVEFEPLPSPLTGPVQPAQVQQGHDRAESDVSDLVLSENVTDTDGSSPNTYHYQHGQGQRLGGPVTNDTNFTTTHAASPMSIEDDQPAEDSEPASLYSHAHGYGQRLEEPTTDYTAYDSITSRIDEAHRAPNARRARAEAATAADLYSGEHGLCQRLGASSIEDVGSAGAGNATTGGVTALNDRRRPVNGGGNEELRVLGRFRHELGPGRRLGEE